jgi:hypothetical protein
MVVVMPCLNPCPLHFLIFSIFLETHEALTAAMNASRTPAATNPQPCSKKKVAAKVGF